MAGPMIILAHAAAFIAGGFLVAWTLLSAVRSVVLPRGVVVRLSRWVFVPISELFRIRLRLAKTWEERDRIMALYGPISLLSLPFAWLVLVLGGYTAIYWSLGGRTLRRSLELSGSSIFTFGFAVPGALAQTLLAFPEAIFGP